MMNVYYWTNFYVNRISADEWSRYCALNTLVRSWIPNLKTNKVNSSSKKHYVTALHWHPYDFWSLRSSEFLRDNLHRLVPASRKENVILFRVIFETKIFVYVSCMRSLIHVVVVVDRTFFVSLKRVNLLQHNTTLFNYKSESCSNGYTFKLWIDFNHKPGCFECHTAWWWHLSLR